MVDSPSIPIICGPTGSGKSAAAVQLAGEFPIEIISADSRQIIKHLNIGTAKPTAEEQRTVRTHLIDLIEPGERYSAFQFIDDCDAAVSETRGRGHIPLVVGGTGLYLKALTEGVIEIDQDSREIRERLESDMARLGPEAMHRRLAEIDPIEARCIHANNQVRVIRALEICELTGRSKTELMVSGAYKKSKYVFSFYCLQPERTVLYRAVDKRVDSMLKNGLLAEVEKLILCGLRPQLERAGVIGYAELLDYFDEKCSLDEAKALIKQNTRRYAKRQTTWFRHQADCAFFTDSEAIKSAVRANIRAKWTELKP